MSEPLKNSRNDDRRKGKGRAAVELPDDEAIRKLFPKKLVEKVNKDVGHEPKTPDRE